MTDEEKVRVEGLLKDLDELPDVLEDEVYEEKYLRFDDKAYSN